MYSTLTGVLPELKRAFNDNELGLIIAHIARAENRDFQHRLQGHRRVMASNLERRLKILSNKVDYFLKKPSKKERFLETVKRSVRSSNYGYSSQTYYENLRIIFYRIFEKYDVNSNGLFSDISNVIYDVFEKQEKDKPLDRQYNCIIDSLFYKFFKD